ncbi:hypothetical protein SEVIR_9G452900v4 [Setaria viridis]
MALGDNSNPASYIHTVQHLIERCMTFGMSMEECMEALAKRADVQPVVTSTGPTIRRNPFFLFVLAAVWNSDGLNNCSVEGAGEGE